MGYVVVWVTLTGPFYPGLTDLYRMQLALCRPKMVRIWVGYAGQFRPYHLLTINSCPDILVMDRLMAICNLGGGNHKGILFFFLLICLSLSLSLFFLNKGDCPYQCTNNRVGPFGGTGFDHNQYLHRSDYIELRS